MYSLVMSHSDRFLSEKFAAVLKSSCGFFFSVPFSFLSLSQALSLWKLPFESEMSELSCHHNLSRERDEIYFEPCRQFISLLCFIFLLL